MKPLEPTEIWMPSYGGTPMKVPDSPRGYANAKIKIDEWAGVDFDSMRKDLQDYIKRATEGQVHAPSTKRSYRDSVTGRQQFYEYSPGHCKHARQGYRVNVWICLGCGTQMR